MSRMNTFEKQTIHETKAFGKQTARETEDYFLLSGKLPDGSAYQLVNSTNDSVFYGTRPNYLAFKTLDVIGLGIGTTVFATASYFAAKHGLEAVVFMQSIDGKTAFEGFGLAIAAFGSGVGAYASILVTRALTGLRHGGLARNVSTGGAVTLDAMAQLDASYSNPK